MVLRVAPRHDFPKTTPQNPEKPSGKKRFSGEFLQISKPRPGFGVVLSLKTTPLSRAWFCSFSQNWASHVVGAPQNPGKLGKTPNFFLPEAGRVFGNPEVLALFGVVSPGFRPEGQNHAGAKKRLLPTGLRDDFFEPVHLCGPGPTNHAVRLF